MHSHLTQIHSVPGCSCGARGKDFNFAMADIWCITSLAISDYSSIMDTLSFPEGTTMADNTQCINISITDNGAFEKDEYFLVHISSEPEVSVPDPFTFVNITDDEGM